ncbi:MAG: CRISPR-associated endoribonuclease Cas6 [Palaeococcus sp.]|uniref:CRISPR-associated endoribonuclease Cas6 n=1 Tax=Palaeococcus sp. (in: euryarchaeotes) TaxID=2820298 RepID=UPI0025F24939|nr:CRISPR-associated endoribonuclease Cas6 [Palaeococcus sp. (in: euryarchaeotes)]MCD6558625.1 CRISPR-associated endoribonuclease Cas6 [Palaeococcus sp. (in: euryarchaeotes)]
MRVEIKFKPENKGAILPFNYNYDVYSELINKIGISSPDVAEMTKTTPSDYFTFSRIMVRSRKLIPEKGIKILSDDVCLYVSSFMPDVIRAIVEGFMDNPVMTIEDVRLFVEKVKVLKEPEFKEGSLLSTLSPIVVRTIKLEEDRMKIWDLYPTDSLFHEKLRKIMLMRYSELVGEMPRDKEFTLEVIKHKPVRIKVRDVFYRGSLMVFRYYGSEEILKFGYENGFGDKTRFGFGMVKVIDEGGKQTSQEQVQEAKL